MILLSDTKRVDLSMTEDQQILDSLKDPSQKEWAFRLLISQYKERLYMHIRKMVLNHDDADDVLQNSLIKVWNGLDTFRGESSLFTWLYRIATNESITFINQRKRRMLPGSNEANEFLVETLESDPYFDGDKWQLLLQRAIAVLPDKQRLVFNMKYFDEIKYEDMAEILNTSVGALKASYHHAVKKIEEYLKIHETGIDP